MEVESVFPNFVAMVERQFEQVITRVRSDNGTKFNCLHDYFFKIMTPYPITYLEQNHNLALAKGEFFVLIF